MKVGIFTFPGSPSYGAALQMFALHTVLSEKCDVEVINYIPEGVIHRKSRKKSFFKAVVAKVYHLFVKESKKQFEVFESQIEKYPEKPIATTEELKAIASRYDRIIAGSDQVWNPVVTSGDVNYYLEFCTHEQKASYAPSFGNEKIEKDVEKIATLLNDFKYLSVREEEGAKIIEELTGKKVPVVLDPTLLLPKSVWQNQIIKGKHSYGKYVLYFTVKPSDTLMKFAEKFAEENGYKLLVIGTYGSPKELFYEKLKNKKTFLFGVGPAEFLSFVNDAEFIITNSFHGTAFSIIFNKDFYVEYSSDTNSRLKNIIRLFELEKCVIDKNTAYKKPTSVDYTDINKKMTLYREESLNYLNSIIGE